jgi:hypothetical protein
MKTDQFILLGANVAIWFEINTKYINTMRQNVKFLNVKTVDASHNQ